LRAPPTKTAEFEVKNKHESSKKKHLLCVTSVIFGSNKVRTTLEKHSTKATAVGESNNAAGRKDLQPPEANRDSRAEPPTLRRFYSLFFQKYAF